MSKKFFRHLNWRGQFNRPWVCRKHEAFGSRPVKDATSEDLLKKDISHGKFLSKRDYRKL